MKPEVIDGVTGLAFVRDPHLLRPRLEGDIECVGQQRVAHAISAVEVLIQD